MSSILAIDTSSELCSVALLFRDKVFTECLDSPRQHSQKLLPLIDQLLINNGLELKDLDAIAYGRGPGSFTGLRICLGIVQGLAFSCDIPVIAVSTLQTLAEGALQQGIVQEGDTLLTALDARMSEVYWSVHQVEANGVAGLELRNISDEFVGPAATVLEFDQLRDVSSERLVMVGPGCHYPELSQYPARDKYQQLLPLAENMLSSAVESLQQGKVIKAEEARPVYLRDSVAWKKRQRIRAS